MTSGTGKSAVRKQPAKASKGAKRQLTGFGNKTDYIDAAEATKKNKNFPEVIRLFGQAIEMQTEGQSDNKPDLFLAQRLALVTYKGAAPQQFRPPVSSSATPIIIDADLARGKPITSIEVNCKIEYA